MELSRSKIKKFIFSQKKTFHMFLEMEPCSFQHKLEKIKKVHPEKISYISGNGNSVKSSLYFRKRNFLIFQEMKLS